MTTNRAPEHLDHAACWTYLRQQEVGRLAVVAGGRPEIFPVNFLVDHGTVLFRTAEGTKLAGAIGRDVAFEVDGYDPGTGSAWSVVVKGRGREITNLFEVLDAIGLPLETWHAGPKPRMVRVEPDEVSGRRFVRAADPAVVRLHRDALE